MPRLNETTTFLSSCSNVSMLMTTATGLFNAGISDPVTYDQLSAGGEPFCGRISDGSISTSQGIAGHTLTGMFSRLATAPLIFHFNFDISQGIDYSFGVCSLTVKWSC